MGTIGGTIATGCVCVEGEGALIAAKWKPCRFQQQYLQLGALRDRAQGTVGGHYSYIVGGVGASCERYGGGLGVISVSSEPKPGDILYTGGVS